MSGGLMYYLECPGKTIKMRGEERLLSLNENNLS
jgi:hypothetical protein